MIHIYTKLVSACLVNTSNGPSRDKTAVDGSTDRAGVDES